MLACNAIELICISEESAGHWLQPKAALTSLLPTHAYTRPTVALCCIGMC